MTTANATTNSLGMMNHLGTELTVDNTVSATKVDVFHRVMPRHEFESVIFGNLLGSTDARLDRLARYILEVSPKMNLNTWVKVAKRGRLIVVKTSRREYRLFMNNLYNRLT